MKKYILSIDAGTTGVTLLLIDKYLNIIEKYYSEIKQFYPNPGWVEHDPFELINLIEKLLLKISNKYNLIDIASIGITNQRETVVVWNKITGKPIYNAIVWQCRRTKKYCNDLIKWKGHNSKIDYKDVVFKKTGLYIDSYFSATKIKWIIDNVENAKELLKKNKLLVGTIDTWIIWNLTNKEHHVTDNTNASRTMLFNINKKIWDKELLKLFNVPKNILPKVKNSMDNFGTALIQNISIPIQGVAGDQQSALFGQGCYIKNTSKCTYGTGLFYLYNTGEKRIDSKNGLITTLALDSQGKPVYAIEGSVFIGGAIIQWIRDEIKLINDASETEKISEKINNTLGVYIVPAFVGLGAPYWNSDCKGIITGLTRGTNKNHIIRASLESIVYQVNDLLNCIRKDTNKSIIKLNVDGGATNNKFLLQFQSDISKIKIIKPKNIESTALGAAILAGVMNGFLDSTEKVFRYKKIENIYQPNMNNLERNNLINGWNNAVKLVNK